MLNDKIDTKSLASIFQIKKRICIRDAFQQDFAERLHYCLDKEVPWGIAYMNSDEKPIILTADKLVKFTSNDWSTVNNKVMKTARDKFQFMYNSYMMINAYKEKRDPELILHRVVEYLNSDAFLTFIKIVTGATDIMKADAQATRYLPGCFLKKHNDLNQEGSRRIAYVLNLTRDWQADWGGMLQFLDAEGNVEETYFPIFNSLTLFQVPMWHDVSYVVPYADIPRYAITGWAMKNQT